MAKPKRVIELSFNNREEVFTLPVNPEEFEITKGNQNQTVSMLNVGEVNLIGNPELAELTLESFFPAPSSPFWRLADRTPAYYMAILEKWKDSKRPIRVIISDTNINLAMAIEKIGRKKKEGCDDHYYTLELKEYRFLNVQPVNNDAEVQDDNGLNDRPDEKGTGGGTHTVVKGDSLWAIANKYYGKGSDYPKIYEANKELMDKKNAEHKTSKYTIYSGQQLVIP